MNTATIDMSLKFSFANDSQYMVYAKAIVVTYTCLASSYHYIYVHADRAVNCQYTEYGKLPKSFY